QRYTEDTGGRQEALRRAVVAEALRDSPGKEALSQEIHWAEHGNETEHPFSTARDVLMVPPRHRAWCPDLHACGTVGIGRNCCASPSGFAKKNSYNSRLIKKPGKCEKLRAFSEK